MEPIITTDIVVAYSQCPRKAYKLLYTDTQGTPHEYIAILEEEARKNRESHLKKIRGKHSDVVPYSPEGVNKGTPIMLEATLLSEDLQTYVDVLTGMEATSSQRRHNYTPTLIVGTHKIRQEQKLQLAFIGYVLSNLQKEKPTYGTIVGGGNTSHTTELETLYKNIGHILRKVRDWTAAQEPESPPVILNRHCPLCPFHKECAAKAEEQDHLSLLKSMSEKEITAQNKKGIFTVTQLSYTYRPRKRRKGKDHQPPKYSHSLKALAIRDDKIYVVEKPQVPQSGTRIFLDVEGVPDQDFYYLIGLLVTEGDATKAFAFWADNHSEEENIWREFLATVKGYSAFILFHYGSYETKFIERMSKKYGREEDEEILQKIKSSLVNTLSLMYANIYFPTYSNSLKDIGSYLGQKWTEENATGLQSLVWRHAWETTREPTFKQILLQYNLEDCFALKKVTEAVENITNKNWENSLSNIALIDDIKIDTTRRFQHNKFIFEDFDFINKCAYFDYQIEKVYFRDKNKRNFISFKKSLSNKKLRINKEIIIPPPQKCYYCNGRVFYKPISTSKIRIDLKFFHYGVKLWVVKYTSGRNRCKFCDHIYLPAEFKNLSEKYGDNLNIWITHQSVALVQTTPKIQENLKGLFNLHLSESSIHYAKKKISDCYQETYNNILKALARGKLIHADETSVSIRGVKGYIWVFTSLEKVYYVYSPTREGDILHEILRGFKGVLISDFYHAYDSYDGPQQKCIIHLMRDMNNDLLTNPFDEQYKFFIKEFSVLFRSIVDTVDKYGLKNQHLNKHKKDVETFFDKYLLNEFESEVLNVYKKRFMSNRKKLFTFLNYDGVPWNNNNAESAIKAFAKYRRVADGTFTENGIKQYLILLSVYQTCHYKGIDFLKFMLSKETDVDRFCNQR